MSKTVQPPKQSEAVFINKVLFGKKPYELTQEAVRADELDKLILGVEPYIYFDKYAPSNCPTDVSSIYKQGICAYAADHPGYDMKRKIEQLVPRLLSTSVGRNALEKIIFSEKYSRDNNGPCLGLDLDEIADLFNQRRTSHNEPRKHSYQESDEQGTLF